MTRPPIKAVEDMTVAEEMICEVIAARERCGETMWTFPSRARKQLRRLEAAGVVGWKPGVVERTCLAWFTDMGRATFLNGDYIPPILR